MIRVLLVALALLGAAYGQVRYESPSLDTYPSDEWRTLYRVPADEDVTFRFALYQQNLDVLEDLFWRVSNPRDPMYMQYMTREELMELVAPPELEQNRVTKWALYNGATSAQSFGDFVVITAAASVVENMLSTELYFVEDRLTGEVMVKIPSGVYTLPDDIANVVEFVQSLTQFVHKRRIGTFGRNLNKVRPFPNLVDSPSEDEVVPETLYTLYNTQNYTITTGVSQCVGEFTTLVYHQSDLQTFSTGVGIQQPQTVKTEGPYNPTIASTECSLDIEYITAMGVNGTNVYWTSTEWILEFAQDLVASGAPPNVVSISWSSDEREEGQTYNFKCDAQFQQLGMMGTSVLAASGDEGAVGTGHCSGNRYAFNPGYPTTSPYVTSVGATMLVGTPDKYTGSQATICSDIKYTCAINGTEDPADENLGGYATGGGFSVYETRPSYQDTAVNEYLNNTSIPKPPSSYYNSANRGFPDVAANGYNYLIVTNGGWGIVGGTSAATPTWGGIFSIMNDYLALNGKATLGFANQLLYQMWEDSPSTFTNIGNLNTNNDDGCGSSLGYTSNPDGWDPVTGLGTANVQNILNYLDSIMSTLPNK